MQRAEEGELRRFFFGYNPTSLYFRVPPERDTQQIFIRFQARYSGLDITSHLRRLLNLIIRTPDQMAGQANAPVHLARVALHFSYLPQG